MRDERFWTQKKGCVIQPLGMPLSYDEGGEDYIRDG